jgi:uncharacterized membrane protein YjgN (DUF898 family)
MNQMSFVPRHLPPTPASFSGERGEFRRLVTRGVLLELITIGFYRFWLATDIRRHLWSNTHVDGDAAEYTGRGKELLIGFLFALAILVPVYLAYFLVSIEAERFKAFAGLPLFAFFYLFGQFAIYRARRYRLTRTVWRGVRFWMDGSGWAYAMRAALWAMLMPLTLGLILPWREAALERYKMRHCYYGELQGSFEGRGWDFFKRGWWLWLLTVVPLIPLPIIWWLLKSSPLLLVSPVGRTASQIAGYAFLLVALSAPFLYGAFKAVEWRWWLSGIRFGEVRFESALRRGALAGLYWKVIGWFLLLVTLFTAYLLAGARLIAGTGGLSLNPAILQQSVSMLVLAGIGYLAFILALNVVNRVYLMRDVWARVVASATVHNIDAVTDISVGGDLADAVGEGLAGGLDVVGF